MEKRDKRREDVQRTEADTAPHERLGMRVDDESGDDTDLDRDGRIDIDPNSAPF
ncbi:hypothetical protein [Paenibacillus sp. GYB003]|uniref:hypothetical protein n=1 Tax=Paenibacillus sp. GYB003 TaxID=2994392 RepID=UPI002F9623D5